MADGSAKPIEDVEIGDMVLATNPETGDQGPRRVTDTIVGDGVKELVDIGADGAIVIATDRHPFWVDDEGRWVDAQDLQDGDVLLGADGTTVAVDSVRERTEVRRVHNLTVDGIHTYYVLAGEQAVLVHNSGCDEFAQAFQRAHGGETHTFQGSPRTGPYALSEESSVWRYHTVVVKDGRVFDQFTGPGGIPIGEWKSLWDYPDAIDFGF